MYVNNLLITGNYVNFVNNIYANFVDNYIII